MWSHKQKTCFFAMAGSHSQAPAGPSVGSPNRLRQTSDHLSRPHILAGSLRITPPSPSCPSQKSFNRRLCSRGAKCSSKSQQPDSKGAHERLRFAGRILVSVSKSRTQRRECFADKVHMPLLESDERLGKSFDRISYKPACKHPGQIDAVWVSLTKIVLEGRCEECQKTSLHEVDLVRVDAWLRRETASPFESGGVEDLE
jgi:hypothetical protein